MIKKIENLNNLKNGIKNRNNYSNEDKFQLVNDYLQKINYSIQDINDEIKDENYSRKTIIYLIVLTDWIKCSYESINDILKDKLSDNFSNRDDNLFNFSKKYFESIRSFIVAHPLNTNRHKNYNLDGNFCCIDIRNVDDMVCLFNKKEECFNIDFGGMHKNMNQNHKNVLLVYSKKYKNNRFYNYITFNINDVLNVARIYVNKIYELDDYLFDLQEVKL